MTNAAVADESEHLGLFHGLLDGAWDLRRCVVRGERTFLVAVRDEPQGAARPVPRDLEVLRLVALGETNLEVAYALGLSESTVRRQVSRVMRRFECDRRIGLVRLGCAKVREVRFDTPQKAFVVRATEPEPLPPRPAHEPVTNAERAVLHEVISGLSNRDIARVRAVSERTVANQVASLFRKYRAGTREELLRRALRPCGQPVSP